MERVHCHFVDLAWRGCAWKIRKAWEGLDAERPGLREGPKVA